jgi:predicted transcriptional regulator
VRDELGLARFEVDSQAHEPDAGGRRRPDQAARMRARHEAAERDAWLRAEIEKGIARADSPDAKWIPHEEVMAKLDARIARLKSAS